MPQVITKIEPIAVKEKNDNERPEASIYIEFTIKLVDVPINVKVPPNIEAYDKGNNNLLEK